MRKIGHVYRITNINSLSEALEENDFRISLGVIYDRIDFNKAGYLEHSDLCAIPGTRLDRFARRFK
jgi:hypothetical protein